MTSKKILFFGNERLATGVTTTAPILRALIEHGYKVEAVITAQDTGTQRSRTQRPTEIATLAAQHDIPVLPVANKLSAIHDSIATYQADIAVLAAFGKLVPVDVISLFPRGIVNIHPSLLPSHRGPTPIESCLLAGETLTGVSLMKLSAKMDAGPLYAQQSISIEAADTKQSLTDKLAILGRDMLLQALPTILDGQLVPHEQDHENAQYDHLIQKRDGLLIDSSWNRPTHQIERQIRAYAGWPRTSTTLLNHQIIITMGHAAEGQGVPGTVYLENHEFGIYTSDGVLIIDSLIPAGKKEMTSEAFLRGYKLTP